MSLRWCKTVTFRAISYANNARPDSKKCTYPRNSEGIEFSMSLIMADQNAFQFHKVNIPPNLLNGKYSFHLGDFDVVVFFFVLAKMVGTVDSDFVCSKTLS